MIRYDDMRVDRLLIQQYQKELEGELKKIKGLNDINVLLREFENTFAQYIGTKYALAVNSGTDALQLSLLVSGIGRGDSVIIPDLTYPAVPLSIVYAGAKPIFIDIKEEDLEINEDLIERHISKNTKAIIAVHMFARPCNIEKIMGIAKKYNLLVIEDVCQAESSEYKGKKLGSFADLSCFSFSYYKPIASCGGGGGMICFNKEEYRKIYNYIKIEKDEAALLSAGKRFPPLYLLDLISIRVKFNYLGDIIKSRLMIKKMYEKALFRIKEIRILKDGLNSISVPQNFILFSKQRERLGNYLLEKGIVWQKPYIPLHLIKIFKKFASNKFPHSEKYWKEALHLPLYSFMKKEECQFVVDSLENFNQQAIR